MLFLSCCGVRRPGAPERRSRAERIQTWLFRSFRRPRLTSSYASSFFPRQLRVKPFMASVSEAQRERGEAITHTVHTHTHLSPLYQTALSTSHYWKTHLRDFCFNRKTLSSSDQSGVVKDLMIYKDVTKACRNQTLHVEVRVLWFLVSLLVLGLQRFVDFVDKNR